MTITGLVLAFASSPATAAPAGPVLDRAYAKAHPTVAHPVIAKRLPPPITLNADGTSTRGSRTATTCPAAVAPPVPLSKGCFQYSRVALNYDFGMSDTSGAGGWSANITIGKPNFGSNAYTWHSLMELAAQSHRNAAGSVGDQTVEVGWTVDFGVNADLNPHFFAFNWKNGHGRYYSADTANTDWVPVTGCTVCGGGGSAGDLSADIGTTQAFSIEHLTGATVPGWYVSYKGIYQVGLPDTFYTCSGCNTGTGTWDTPVTFIRAPAHQAFGELAVAGSIPPASGDGFGAPAADSAIYTGCTDMGNGINPHVDPTNSARLSSLHYTDIDPPGSMDDNWPLSSVMELSDSNAPSSAGAHWGAVGIGNGHGTDVNGVRVGGPGYGSRGSWTPNGWKDTCGPTVEGTPLASGIQAWLEPVTGDATGLKGNTNAWSHAWSTAVINSCNSVSGDPVQDSWRVWNNSLSSGKAFKVYATGTCGSTSALVTNASKVVTGWPIHAWARVS